MTGPMVFDATPYPLLPDPCDGVTAFKGVGTTTDRNFAKVNTWIAGAGFEVIEKEYGQVQDLRPSGNADWLAIPGYFPAFSYTVPDKCLGLLITLHAWVGAMNASRAYLSLYLSGNGIINPLDKNFHMVGAQDGEVFSAHSVLYLAADLRSGQPIAVEPRAFYWDAAPGPTYILASWVSLMAFREL